MEDTLPPVETAKYYVRNYGPWVVVEYELNCGGVIGHTTALGDGAGPCFQRGQWTDQFLFLFNRADSYHSAEQVHDNKVVTAEGSSRCHRGADGLITTEPNRTMIVRTADCMPVYLWETERGHEGAQRRALLHAGWRGLVKDIVPQTIQSRFEGAVNVFVGPHIGVDHYEVGEDVISSVRESLGFNRDELKNRDLVTADDHANLFGILRAQLGQLDRGVRMFRSPMDTCQSGPVPLLSYRKQETEHRMLNWYASPAEVE